MGCSDYVKNKAEKLTASKDSINYYLTIQQLYLSCYILYIAMEYLCSNCRYLFPYTSEVINYRILS